MKHKLHAVRGGYESEVDLESGLGHACRDLSAGWFWSCYSSRKNESLLSVVFVFYLSWIARWRLMWYGCCRCKIRMLQSTVEWSQVWSPYRRVRVSQNFCKPMERTVPEVFQILRSNSTILSKFELWISFILVVCLTFCEDFHPGHFSLWK